MLQLPIVQLKKGSIFLPQAAKQTLDAVANIALQHLDCNISVTAHGVYCELCAQRAWDKVYSVARYLMQKGVDTGRIIWNYDSGENRTQVSLAFTSQTVPTWRQSPPPIPCYSYHRLTPCRCKNSDGHVEPED